LISLSSDALIIDNFSRRLNRELFLEILKRRFFN